MLRRYFACIALIFIIGFQARITFAVGRVFRFNTDNGSKQIIFYSKAPIENIEGVAESINGLVYFEPQSKGFYMNGNVSCSVESMRTGVAIRDDHLRSQDWLDAARYPVISFKLLPFDKSSIRQDQDNAWSAKAKGLFTLKGAQKKVIAPITITLSDDKLNISGQFLVRLSDYGITGPKAMNFVGLRVAEEVRVKISLVGVASNESPPPTLLPAAQKKNWVAKRTGKNTLGNTMARKKALTRKISER